jgi:aryl-alcohol dehydrogenase-like predicted oxidoreductase
MKKVQLGTSDVYVSPITFGAWAIGGWMWGGADKKDASEALATAVAMGITTIDTAPVYGFGLSEEIVGKSIRGNRQNVEILTKYGLIWDTKKGDFYFDSVHNDGYPVKIYRYASKESIINECEQSLKRLKTDYIDLYQIHWSDRTTPIEESMEAVELLIQQGKVKAAGVCNFSLEQTISASNTIQLTSNQVPYSMLRRDIEADLLPWCIDNKVSVLAYSPLQRGLLTGKITPLYKFAEGDSRPKMPQYLPDNILRVNLFLESIRPLANKYNASLSQLVIAWTLRQAGITVALVGARNSAQVEENARAMKINLSIQDIQDITTKLNQLELIL